jgi:magnesium and cobalt transporter
MNNHESANRSWLERLAHLFSRPKNQEELLDVLNEATEDHLLDTGALRMIEGVLDVYDHQVRDVMIPRSQMVVIDAENSLEDILPVVISSAHSRFPVIKENLDEVVGILLAKDLLPYTFNKQESFNLQKLLRTVTFIPESKRLNVLLEEFRATRSHIAIVVDEYGSISGMITIEDVLEQIVGKIEDEYDVEETETNIMQLEDGICNIKALTPIDEFNEFFHAEFSDEHFDTIGGLVAQQFGHLPKRDETVVMKGFEFKVLHADKRKIRLLQVKRMGNE